MKFFEARRIALRLASVTGERMVLYSEEKGRWIFKRHVYSVSSFSTFHRVRQLKKTAIRQLLMYPDGKIVH